MELHEYLIQYPNTATAATVAAVAVLVAAVVAALAAIRWHFYGDALPPAGHCGSCDGRICRPEQCDFALCDDREWLLEDVH